MKNLENDLTIAFTPEGTGTDSDINAPKLEYMKGKQTAEKYRVCAYEYVKAIAGKDEIVLNVIYQILRETSSYENGDKETIDYAEELITLIELSAERPHRKILLLANLFNLAPLCQLRFDSQEEIREICRIVRDSYDIGEYYVSGLNATLTGYEIAPVSGRNEINMNRPLKVSQMEPGTHDDDPTA